MKKQTKIDFNKPTIEQEHPIVKEGGEGTQKLWKFKNGYGASVVRFAISDKFKIGNREKIGSYGINAGLWELAVIKFGPNDDTEHGKPGFNICYDTKITSDVMGYLTEEKVVEILNKIQKLKRKKQNKNGK